MTVKLDYLCPDCRHDLSTRGSDYYCPKCKRKFCSDQGILKLLPRFLEDNKVKEDLVYNLKGEDNSWYSGKVWYYLVHLSSHIVRFENEVLPKIKGPRVLELACGNGWASMLVKRQDKNICCVASDISFNSINIQGKQMSRIMETAPDSWVVCDAEKLPFPNNYFDTVFVIASLHHFPNIPIALAEVKRVLKAGGRFIAIDGLMPTIAQKLLKGENSPRTKNYGILERKITYDEWLKYLYDSGLPASCLHLYFNPGYLHEYATNEDEEKLIKKNWLYRVAKEIIYGAILSKMNSSYVKLLKLTSVFPCGVVIDYQKDQI